MRLKQHRRREHGLLWIRSALSLSTPAVTSCPSQSERDYSSHAPGWAISSGLLIAREKWPRRVGALAAPFDVAALPADFISCPTWSGCSARTARAQPRSRYGGVRERSEWTRLPGRMRLQWPPAFPGWMTSWPAATPPTAPTWSRVGPGPARPRSGLQFLIDGAAGERCLYITLSESKRELLSVAGRHGWSLDGLEIYELVPPELSLDPKQQQSLVYASDLELGETVNMVLAEVERVRPSRVVFDSLSEIRLLSQGSLRYRRQVLALKHFFLLHNATVLLLDDLTAHEDDLNLHSLSHAVIHLEQLAPAYGAERRRIRVIKMRGMHFRGGYHDFVIRRGGLQVFPRLVAAEHHRASGSSPSRAASPNSTRCSEVGSILERARCSSAPPAAGKSSLALGYVSRRPESG